MLERFVTEEDIKAKIKDMRYVRIEGTTLHLMGADMLEGLQRPWGECVRGPGALQSGEGRGESL